MEVQSVAMENGSVWRRALGETGGPQLAEARQRAGGETKSRIVNRRLGEEIVICSRWRCKTCNLRS